MAAAMVGYLRILMSSFARWVRTAAASLLLLRCSLTIFARQMVTRGVISCDLAASLAIVLIIVVSKRGVRADPDTLSASLAAESNAVSAMLASYASGSIA